MNFRLSDEKIIVPKKKIQHTQILRRLLFCIFTLGYLYKSVPTIDLLAIVVQRSVERSVAIICELVAVKVEVIYCIVNDFIKQHCSEDVSKVHTATATQTFAHIGNAWVNVEVIANVVDVLAGI